MKTNKKGFTLIELLAVIVILGIILLIATPIILDVISDARQSSAEKSAQMFLKQAQQDKVTSDLSSNVIPEGNIADVDGTSSSAYTVKMSEQPETYCLSFDSSLNTNGVIQYKLGPTTYFFVVANGDITTVANAADATYTAANTACR